MCPKQLRAAIKDDPDALALFDVAIGRERGGNNNPHGCKGKPDEEPSEVKSASREEGGINDGITIIDSPEPQPVKRTGVNDVSYAHRRLHKDRPDLFEKVKAGEMSANAAMIEAGFRKVPTRFQRQR